MKHALRIVPFVLCLMMAPVGVASAADISGKYVGRYQCGQWNTLELQISESGNGSISGVFTFSLQAFGQSGTASYSMIGKYDAATGRFQLAPEKWVSGRPRNVTMVGLQGTFDLATRRLRGKVDDFNCTSFEVAPPGVALTALPPPPAAPLPPERRPFPSSVTDLKDTFEYWDSAMSDAPGSVRESEPIDDVIDWLRKEKFSCMTTNRVRWDSTGLKGSVPDVVQRRERFVIECDGNCKGLRYFPYVGADVLHFGATQPVPVLEIRNVWLGELRFRWDFTRESSTQPPPDIYIHRWTSSGFNASGNCKAPKANNKEGR